MSYHKHIWHIDTDEHMIERYILLFVINFNNPMLIKKVLGINNVLNLEEVIIKICDIIQIAPYKRRKHPSVKHFLENLAMFGDTVLLNKITDFIGARQKKRYVGKYSVVFDTARISNILALRGNHPTGVPHYYVDGDNYDGRVLAVTQCVCCTGFLRAIMVRNADLHDIAHRICKFHNQLICAYENSMILFVFPENRQLLDLIIARSGRAILEEMYKNLKVLIAKISPLTDVPFPALLLWIQLLVELAVRYPVGFYNFLMHRSGRIDIPYKPYYLDVPHMYETGTFMRVAEYIDCVFHPNNLIKFNHTHPYRDVTIQFARAVVDIDYAEPLPKRMRM